MNENTIGEIYSETGPTTSDLVNIEKQQMSMDPEEIKKLYTKDNPHITGAYWDLEESKWKGYKAKKGVSPPWVPYSKKRIRTEPSLKEKKFMWVLSKTASLAEAYRATYRTRIFDDKRVESARARDLGEQVLRRIKKNFPEWVKAFTFSDFTPEFIRGELMNLYSSDHSTIAEKTRILENMAKIEAMFTEKKIIDTKIREVVEPLYAETDDDFPRYRDERISRTEVEKALIKNDENDK